MLLVLILMFTALPVVELYLLFKAGAIIGAGSTLLLVLGTGLVGAWVAKSQGRQILYRAQKELQNGQLPADQLIHGLLVFTGGLLLMTPGFVTDFMGMWMIFPLTRVLLIIVVRKWFERGLRSGRIFYYGGTSGAGTDSSYTIHRESLHQHSRGSVDDEEEFRPPPRDVTPPKPRA
jgi:UPF0716 protein FxsA